MISEGQIRRVLHGIREQLWPDDGRTAQALLEATNATTDALAQLATARARQATAFGDACARGWSDVEISRLTGVDGATVRQQRRATVVSQHGPAA